MKEYIEREWLVNDALAVLDFRKKHYMDKARIADAASTVEWLKYYAPAADVVERKRGEWIVTECDSGEPEYYPPFIEFHCPFCNEPYSLESGEYNWYYGDAIPFKFCHECGADMRSHQNILCDQTEEVDHEN